MFRRLLHTGQIGVEDRCFTVHDFEQMTARGGRRVSCEVVLDAGDRIILDDDALASLEAKVARLARANDLQPGAGVEGAARRRVGMPAAVAVSAGARRT